MERGRRRTPGRKKKPKRGAIVEPLTVDQVAKWMIRDERTFARVCVDIVRRALTIVIRRTRGNRSKAARILGIDRRTMKRRMMWLGISG